MVEKIILEISNMDLDLNNKSTYSDDASLDMEDSIIHSAGPPPNLDNSRTETTEQYPNLDDSCRANLSANQNIPVIPSSDNTSLDMEDSNTRSFNPPPYVYNSSTVTPEQGILVIHRSNPSANDSSTVTPSRPSIPRDISIEEISNEISNLNLDFNNTTAYSECISLDMEDSNIRSFNPFPYVDNSSTETTEQIPNLIPGRRPSLSQALSVHEILREMTRYQPPSPISPIGSPSYSRNSNSLDPNMEN